jgi:V-type H+-transporting ATPase 16kDa proteolipid subunit
MSDISVDIAIGAAFGTGKAGIGIAGLGSFRPELVMKVSLNTQV